MWYGRTIGWVYVDGKCLNEELLRNSLALQAIFLRPEAGGHGGFGKAPESGPVERSEFNPTMGTSAF